MHALPKYLGSYAEPEAALAGHVPGAYERVLVVPAFQEDPRFLDGYSAAFAAAAGKSLCVVVANAKDSVSPERGADCERLRDALLARLGSVRRVAPLAFAGTFGEVDVLVVDRVTERIPAKQGVGLARKIGVDVALAVYAAGRVASPFLHFGDADATLPEDYFARVAGAANAGASVALYPFWHVAGDEPSVARATSLYEVSLRYFVAGLAHARSPYAFQALGSTLAVRAESYAAVRGVPRREAAEDFYLLNKLAKVGKVLRLAGEPVLLRARRSDRVPFGTGASVTPFEGSDVSFYAPECFAAFGGALRALDAFAEHADVNRFVSALGALGPAGDVILAALGPADVRDALGAAAREAPSVPARRARVHGWFDAFRTMKVIHALRDRVFPSLPWRVALERAPFAPRIASGEGDPQLTLLRRAMQTAEDATPAWLGPAAFPPE